MRRRGVLLHSRAACCKERVMNRFEVGQQVVCVNAGNISTSWNINLQFLKEKAVYTLSWVGIGIDIMGREGVAVKLAEVPVDGCFDQQRFKPVDDAKLEQFRKLLSPGPKVKSKTKENA
jgi:hypothetical protein